MVNGILNNINVRGGATATSLANAFVTRVEEDGGVVESQSCLTDRIDNLKRLGLWNKASAVWLPHGYKEGKLYAAKGGSAADLTITRAGTRTRKGPTYVEQVPYNLLRGSQGGFNTTSNWIKLGVPSVTVVDNSAVAPDGSMTASIMTVNSTGGQGLRNQIPYLGAVGDTYTVSVWLRSDDSVSVTLDVGDKNPTTFPLTSTWQRYTVTGTLTVPIVLFMDITFPPGVVSGSTCEMWGAQLVQGSSALDYFPTTNRFNVPALDYTNDTCPALSLEPARTNLLLRSQDYSASWSLANVGVTSNDNSAPDGLSTASLFTTTVSGNNTFTQSLAVTASTTYTLSWYAKRGTCAVMKYRVRDNSAGVDIISATNYHASLSDTEWVRMRVTFTTPVGCVGIGVYPNLDSDIGTFYIWGVQLEAGAYATSYIPTTTATVSRIADAVTSLTGVSDLIGQTEGTLYWEGRLPADNTFKGIMFVGDGTINNRLGIYADNNNKINGAVVVESSTGGNGALIFTTDSYTSDQLIKVCFVYGPNYAALFVNGDEIGEDLTVVAPLSMSAISKTTVPGSITNPFYGTDNIMLLSPIKITDAEAIALTTP